MNSIDFLAKVMATDGSRLKTTPDLDHIELWDDEELLSTIDKVSNGYYLCASTRTFKPLVFRFDKVSIMSADCYNLDEYVQCGVMKSSEFNLYSAMIKVARDTIQNGGK